MLTVTPTVGVTVNMPASSETPACCGSARPVWGHGPGADGARRLPSVLELLDGGVAAVGVVGEEAVHARLEEDLDLTLDVADAVRVGRRAELRGKELVLAAEGPAVHLEPGAVGVADHRGRLRQGAVGVA